MTPACVDKETPQIRIEHIELGRAWLALVPAPATSEGRIRLCLGHPCRVKNPKAEKEKTKAKTNGIYIWRNYLHLNRISVTVFLRSAVSSTAVITFMENTRAFTRTVLTNHGTYAPRIWFKFALLGAHNWLDLLTLIQPSILRLTFTLFFFLFLLSFSSFSFLSCISSVVCISFLLYLMSQCIITAGVIGFACILLYGFDERKQLKASRTPVLGSWFRALKFQKGKKENRNFRKQSESLCAGRSGFECSSASLGCLALRAAFIFLRSPGENLALNLIHRISFSFPFSFRFFSIRFSLFWFLGGCVMGLHSKGGLSVPGGVSELCLLIFYFPTCVFIPS